MIKIRVNTAKITTFDNDITNLWVLTDNGNFLIENNETYQITTKGSVIKFIKLVFPKGMLLTERVQIINEQIEKILSFQEEKNFFRTETEKEIFLYDNSELKFYAKIYGTKGMIIIKYF